MARTTPGVSLETKPIREGFKPAVAELVRVPPSVDDGVDQGVDQGVDPDDVSSE
jgi:hypothetical protein